MWKRTVSIYCLLLVSSGIFATEIDSNSLLFTIGEQIKGCAPRFDLKGTYKEEPSLDDLLKDDLTCIQKISDTLMRFLAPQLSADDGYADEIEFGHARLYYMHKSRHGTNDGKYCSTIERVARDKMWFTTVSCLASHYDQINSNKQRKICNVIETACDRRTDPDPYMISVQFTLSARPEYPLRVLSIDLLIPERFSNDWYVNRVRIQYSANSMAYISLAITRHTTPEIPNLISS